MNDIQNIQLENLDISEDRKYMIRILQNTYRENLDFIQHYLNQNNIIHQNINNLINNSFPSRIRTNNASSIFHRPISRRRPPPPPSQAQPIRYTVTEDPRTQLPNTTRTYTNGYNYFVLNPSNEETLLAEVDIPTTSLSTDIMHLIQNIFQQNANLLPTTEQITSATQTIKYSDIVNPRQTECSICFERFQPDEMVMVIRHCGHIFKPTHLNEWFTRTSTCPVCRYDIRTYSPNVNVIGSVIS